MEEDDNFFSFHELFQEPPSRNHPTVISHNLDLDPDEWVMPLDFEFHDEPLRTDTYKEEIYNRIDPLTFEVTVRTFESDVFRHTTYRRLISEEKRIHRVSLNFSFEQSPHGSSSNLPPSAKEASIA